MAKRSTKNPTKRSSTKKTVVGDELQESDYDEIDNFQRQREEILFAEESDANSYGEGDLEEEAVIDLGSEDDEESEYDANGFGSDADFLRPSEEEEEEEQDWGRKKQSYYSADKNVAIEEEAAEARRLQKQKLSLLSLKDFGTDELKIKAISKSAKTFELDVSEDEIDKEQDVPLDASPAEKKAILEKHSSDFVRLLEEFKPRLAEIKDHLGPLMTRLQEANVPTSEGLSFLKTKYQILLSYCANMSFYLLLKVKGKATANHPVIGRLIKYRLILEKMRPMEAKLKYQIEKLVQAASRPMSNSASVDRVDNSLQYRPNPNALMADGSGSNASDDEQGVYKAPKLAPVFFEENENEKTRRAKYEERLKKQASKSRLLKDLCDEFGDAPEQESLNLTKPNQHGDFVDERDAFEEENFVRFTVSKKEKKRLEKQESKFVDELDAFNDFFDGLDSRKTEDDNLHPKKALSKYLAQLSSSKKRARSGDDDIPYKSDSNRKTRQAEKKTAYCASDESEIEDDTRSAGNEYYKAVKANHDARRRPQDRPKPRVQFREIVNQDVSKSRPANYTILRNRGLTPSRNKEVRNPRIRQRNRFEKASKKIKSLHPVHELGKGGKYDGEKTGIRTTLSRSVKF